MITIDKLEEIKTIKVIFENLKIIKKGFIVEKFIQKINEDLFTTIEEEICTLLYQFCEYNLWSERTLGSVFRDLSIYLMINSKKENDIENETKYYRSITHVRRIHRFAVEVTLFHCRVYRIYTDTEFPFQCPSIRFVKHLDKDNDDRIWDEKIKVEQLWSPVKTLAVLVIQFDYYNYAGKYHI